VSENRIFEINFLQNPLCFTAGKSDTGPVSHPVSQILLGWIEWFWIRRPRNQFPVDEECGLISALSPDQQELGETARTEMFFQDQFLDNHE
jgi:hypothetical protein